MTATGGCARQWPMQQAAKKNKNNNIKLKICISMHTDENTSCCLKQHIITTTTHFDVVLAYHDSDWGSHKTMADAASSKAKIKVINKIKHIYISVHTDGDT